MARSRVTFVEKPGAMERLARSAGVQRHSLQAAQAGQGFAESIAPVGPTGNYKRGFRVRAEQVSVPGRDGGRRAGALLYNVAPHAYLVEVRNGAAVLQQTKAWIEQNF